MPTKKLLSVRSLKKYFPIKKEGLFGKTGRFVRANESVSLDIYEGETLGLVGESGCGKSTFGRVLLRLYDKTAGSIRYYGRTLAELSPDYVERTFRTAVADIAAYRQSASHTPRARALFFENTVSLLGGLASLDDCREGVTLSYRKYRADVEAAICRARLSALGEGDEEFSEAQARLFSAEERAASLACELEALRGVYRGNDIFREYEARRDLGIDLSRLTPREMRFLRKDLQIVFQDPYSSLNPRMTVGAILREGILTHGLYQRSSRALEDYLHELVDRCGLQPYMLSRYPHQFSGGQRQRIAIARALAVKPRFIVCDECVSALDVSIGAQIVNLLDELKRENRLTYLFISHDLSVVRHISDRVGVMYLGSLVELAPTDALFRAPLHPYTAALLSAIPTTDPDDRRERILLSGSIPSPVDPPSGCKFHTRCDRACERCRRETPPLVEVSDGHFVACHRVTPIG